MRQKMKQRWWLRNSRSWIDSTDGFRRQQRGQHGAAADQEATEGDERDEAVMEAARSEGALAESPTVNEQTTTFLSTGDKATAMVPTDGKGAAVPEWVQHRYSR